MSKASRRSSRTTRGAAGRPTSPGPPRGGPAANPVDAPSSTGNANSANGSPSSSQPVPTVDARSLSSRAPAGRTTAARSPGTRPSSGRTGAASRPRRPLYQPSFYQRHRTALFGAGLLVIVAVIGAFFFFSVTASAYSCGTTPAPLPAATPLPNGSPAPLGQAQPDMGNLHIAVGSGQRYAYCPPASGPHYNNPGIDGPIPAKFYGPDEGTRPEGWIHNMEHGAVVILYNCKLGACDSATQAALQAIPVGFPDSPVCGVKAGNLAPVIARFDSMPTEFAAIVWDRVLYLNTLDVNQIKAFYAQQGEQYNPEPQCTRPSPGASSGPSSVPSTGPSAVPSTAPSATPSSTPAPTASPSAS